MEISENQGRNMAESSAKWEAASEACLGELPIATVGRRTLWSGSSRRTSDEHGRTGKEFRLQSIAKVGCQQEHQNRLAVSTSGL